MSVPFLKSDFNYPEASTFHFLEVLLQFHIKKMEVYLTLSNTIGIVQQYRFLPTPKLYFQLALNYIHLLNWYSNIAILSINVNFSSTIHTSTKKQTNKPRNLKPE